MENLDDLTILLEEMQQNQTTDYTDLLYQLNQAISDTNDILRYILCLIFFIIIVIVCRFAYKHFVQFFN